MLWRRTLRAALWIGCIFMQSHSFVIPSDNITFCDELVDDVPPEICQSLDVVSVCTQPGVRESCAKTCAGCPSDPIRSTTPSLIAQIEKCDHIQNILENEVCVKLKNLDMCLQQDFRSKCNFTCSNCPDDVVVVVTPPPTPTAVDVDLRIQKGCDELQDDIAENVCAIFLGNGMCNDELPRQQCSFTCLGCIHTTQIVSTSTDATEVDVMDTFSSMVIIFDGKLKNSDEVERFRHEILTIAMSWDDNFNRVLIDPFTVDVKIKLEPISATITFYPLSGVDTSHIRLFVGIINLNPLHISVSDVSSPASKHVFILTNDIAGTEAEIDLLQSISSSDSKDNSTIPSVQFVMTGNIAVLAQSQLAYLKTAIMSELLLRVSNPELQILGIELVKSQSSNDKEAPSTVFRVSILCEHNHRVEVALSHLVRSINVDGDDVNNNDNNNNSNNHFTVTAGGQEFDVIAASMFLLDTYNVAASHLKSVSTGIPTRVPKAGLVTNSPTNNNNNNNNNNNVNDTQPVDMHGSFNESVLEIKNNDSDGDDNTITPILVAVIPLLVVLAMVLATVRYRVRKKEELTKGTPFSAPMKLGHSGQIDTDRPGYTAQEQSAGNVFLRSMLKLTWQQVNESNADQDVENMEYDDEIGALEAVNAARKKRRARHVHFADTVDKISDTPRARRDFAKKKAKEKKHALKRSVKSTSHQPQQQQPQQQQQQTQQQQQQQQQQHHHLEHQHQAQQLRDELHAREEEVEKEIHNNDVHSENRSESPLRQRSSTSYLRIASFAGESDDVGHRNKHVKILDDTFEESTQTSESDYGGDLKLATRTQTKGHNARVVFDVCDSVASDSVVDDTSEISDDRDDNHNIQLETNTSVEQNVSDAKLANRAHTNFAKNLTKIQTKIQSKMQTKKKTIVADSEHDILTHGIILQPPK